MDAWQRVSGRQISKFRRIIEAFCPEIILKPGDLWKFKGSLVRIATLKPQGRTQRIQIAYHFIWDIPTEEDIRKRYPLMSDHLVRLRYADFQHHVKQWGRGDVEMVVVEILGKYDPQAITVLNLDPKNFRPLWMEYRNGAHFLGVVKQITRWQWNKLGNNRIKVLFSKQDWQRMKEKLVLVIDSYHHSFFSPTELDNPKILARVIHWKQRVLPKWRYFNANLWRAYQVIAKKRGHQPWEVA